MKISNMKELCDIGDIKCAYCGKVLTNHPEKANLKIVVEDETDKVLSIIPVCKGKCDEEHMHNTMATTDKWRDMSCLYNPLTRIRFENALLKRACKGQVTEEALSSIQEILISSAPYVIRDLEQKELDEFWIDKSLIM